VVRLPNFLQFTPDERRAALALLLFTGGGSLILELGKRHPEWMPDLKTVHRTVTTQGTVTTQPPARRKTMDSSMVVAGMGGGGGAGGEGGEAADVGAGVVAGVGAGAASGTDARGSRHRNDHPSSTRKKASPASPVHVNTADANVLMTLPGIGPAMAARIIEDRKQNGLYRTLEDLARVKGIGKATLARLKPLVVVP
jgi:competence ComEA-like helix-hairpin-helix protein